MQDYFAKNKLILIIILILILFSVTSIYFYLNNKNSLRKVIIEEKPKVTHELIGKSVEGRNIEAFSYGNGENNIFFIGGIHGGYEWNSVILSYKFIDYLNNNPDFIPTKIKITVIPSLNPDGVYKITNKEWPFGISDIPKKVSTAPGRFNANNVDLNRNFDCNWKATSTWQNKTVSAGSEVFSEPESMALKNYVLKNKPISVIFWHSMSGAIYASECKNGILPETKNIMRAYEKGSGYKSNNSFTSYTVTGDAGDWLSSINIPAITVELKTHETIEWEENLAGIKSLLDYYKNSII
jgi:uncharacterized protein (UPF0333 family)